MSDHFRTGHSRARTKQRLFKHLQFIGFRQRSNSSGEFAACGVAVGGEKLGEFPAKAQAGGADLDSGCGAPSQFGIVEHEGILWVEWVEGKWGQYGERFGGAHQSQARRLHLTAITDTDQIES